MNLPPRGKGMEERDGESEREEGEGVRQSNDEACRNDRLLDTTSFPSPPMTYFYLFINFSSGAAPVKGKTPNYKEESLLISCNLGYDSNSSLQED